MGLTWHQAQMLADLAARKGCITQVSHQRRSCPLLVKMREECLQRGPITHAVCEFFKSMIAPMHGARDHMMDDCTHSIDTVRWMCGGEVVKVESHCKRVGVPDINCDRQRGVALVNELGERTARIQSPDARPGHLHGRRGRG